eukprot:Gb_23949 [translate_table: standard]
MASYLLLLILLLACSISFARSSFHSHRHLNNASDQHALLAFKAAITDDPLNVLGNWNPNISFCNWTSVKCSSHTQRVVWLNLAGMDLRGSISPFLGNLSFLRGLRFNYNALHGHVPSELGRLSRLRSLQFYSNHSQVQSQSTNLRVLTLPKNQLIGPLHKTARIRSICKSIEWKHSCFSVQLYPTACIGIGLQPIEWDGADRVGTGNLNILTALTNCSRLQQIALAFNRFTGVLPSSIDHLPPTLSVLYLGNNEIGGRLPEQIGNLTNLTLLDLGVNLFNGRIPSTLYRLQNLQRLYMEGNNFEGSIPGEIGLIKSLGLLVLSGNKLSGRIPDSLCRLPQLRSLYLDQNHLSGSIPASLGESNKTLELLDLSYNRLTGNIPPQVAGLANLQFYIDLSGNSLQGSLPLEISKMTMVKFQLHLANYKTSRTWISLPIIYQVDRRSPKSRDFCPPQCFCIYGKLWLVRNMGAIAKVSSCHNWKTQTRKSLALKLGPVRISYQELVTATNEFNEDNLLGVGSFGRVYKGVLNDSTIVAVKILNLQNEDAHKSFTRECKILGRVQHRNLIKVITSCSNLDFKALILPFMSSGTIHSLLHLHSWALSAILLQGDVYSYGIVLLELLTRKRPTHEMFTGALDLPKWVSKDFPNKIVEVVDRKLLCIESDDGTIQQKILDFLTGLLRVGLLCTKESPEERPTMREVVVLLEIIKAGFVGTTRASMVASDISSLLANTNILHNASGGGFGSQTSSTL